MEELPVDPEWEVHPAEVKRWMEAGKEFLLLDVRRPAEWEAARVEGAVLVPMQQLAGRTGEIEALGGGRGKKIAVICHHGVRSLKVTAFLRGAGFEDVYSVAGGIEAYSLLVDPSVPRY